MSLIRPAIQSSHLAIARRASDSAAKFDLENLYIPTVRATAHPAQLLQLRRRVQCAAVKTDVVAATARAAAGCQPSESAQLRNSCSPAAGSSKRILTTTEASQAAREVVEGLKDTISFCSEHGIAPTVQQKLQERLLQQQDLVAWLDQHEASQSLSAAADVSQTGAFNQITSTALANDCSLTQTAAEAVPAAENTNSSYTAAASASSPLLIPQPIILEAAQPHVLQPRRSSIDVLDLPRHDTAKHQLKGIWAGSAASRGLKKSMEDCHAVHVLHPELGVQHHTQFANSTDSTFFAGVYDGHGGKSTAAYAAHQLPTLLNKELSSQELSALKHQGMLSGAFHKLDKDWLYHGDAEHSGSTAVTALINKNNLLVANAGDSVAVLAHGGSSLRLSESHKLSHPAELERISALGGILVRDKAGNLRLMQSPLRIQKYVAPMSLAVTRGFGDFGFKGVGGDLVIPTPHVAELALTPEDQLLLLTSDGVTDVMADDSMMEIALDALAKARDTTDNGNELSAAAAAAVKNAALTAGAWDNLTVVALLLDWSK